jgi:hypothetical protein
MNAEKELLLALLIEKYTATKPTLITQTITAKVTKKRKRKPNKQKTHKWTTAEKQFVWDMKVKDNWSFDSIAVRLGLTVKQVSSMYANLLSAKRRSENG